MVLPIKLVVIAPPVFGSTFGNVSVNGAPKPSTSPRLVPRSAMTSIAPVPEKRFPPAATAALSAIVTLVADTSRPLATPPARPANVMPPSPAARLPLTVTLVRLKLPAQFGFAEDVTHRFPMPAAEDEVLPAIVT